MTGSSTFAQAGGSRPLDACLRCGAETHSAGVEEFRVGGTSGGWKLLFGEWAELGEEKISFEMHVCPNCRHVELRAPTGR